MRAILCLARGQVVRASTEYIVDVESLQLKVQYCVERAEQAKRDDVRRRWLEAADSWRLAIEYRIIVPDLIADWTNLKLVAAGQPVPSPGKRRLGGPRLGLGLEPAPVEKLAFQHGEEALANGIVVGVSD